MAAALARVTLGWPARAPSSGGVGSGVTVRLTAKDGARALMRRVQLLLSAERSRAHRQARALDGDLSCIH
jgi:hypothetical protein